MGGVDGPIRSGRQADRRAKWVGKEAHGEMSRQMPEVDRQDRENESRRRKVEKEEKGREKKMRISEWKARSLFGALSQCSSSSIESKDAFINSSISSS